MRSNISNCGNTGPARSAARLPRNDPGSNDMVPAGFSLAAIKHRTIVLTALALVLGLTAACETSGERALREEREAYIESLDLEELKGSLETVNPDPYTDGTIKPRYGKKR